MVKRLFPLFLDEVRKLSDPRDPELVDYTLASVLWAPILMFVCRLGARRKIHHVLNTPRLARYLSLLAELADALKRSFLADDLPTDHELRAFLETPIQVRLDTS